MSARRSRRRPKTHKKVSTSSLTEDIVEIMGDESQVDKKEPPDDVTEEPETPKTTKVATRKKEKKKKDEKPPADQDTETKEPRPIDDNPF